ncbi:GNAT family N-acetyltransferase [Clostridium sp. 'White wine YQ']|uniref:GNAT family N-acetyltransferase n=1 Tax=Clostridium sp. 'White wine YQ' TaxID=3027474 RepID=UPI0023672AF0|nr:GNAT family N-acetyltransferase [Clostridium sp. 'White wine YQ']MDD7793529.1 GNAT family N-acetyltransferase [Clostridium sp. 'White wine YQ']
MEIKIRSMVEQDWRCVATIYQQGMDTNISTFQTECPSYEEWDKGHVKSCRLVAVDGEQVIGWAALSAVSSRCVYAGVGELSIYVDNNYKGKGVGSKLLSSLIAESENHEFWTIQSGIMEENEASLNLHKKCGFREIGYREKVGKDRHGKWRNTILMEKRSSLDKYN